MSAEFNSGFYGTMMVLFVLRMVILLVRHSTLVMFLGWEFLGLTSFVLILYYQA